MAAKLGGLLAAVGGGLWMAPTTVEPLVSAAGTRWGGAPLEWSLTGLWLVAAWMGFRTMETLFRSAGTAGLALLPLHGGALALDRAVRVAAPMTQLALLASAFLLPWAVGAGGPALWSTLAFVWLGAVVVVGSALGAVVLVGNGIAGGANGRTTSAGAWNAAPTVALIVAGILLVLLKLGVEEPLRMLSEQRRFFVPRSGWVVGGFAVVASTLLGVRGVVGFARQHRHLVASFAETDRVVPAASTVDLYAGELERMPHLARALTGPVAWLFRKDRVTLERSAGPVRAIWIGAAVVLAVATLVTTDLPGAAFWILGLVAALHWVHAPARRLARAPGEEASGLAAMLATPRQRAQARAFAASHAQFVLGVWLLPLGLSAMLSRGDVVPVTVALFGWALLVWAPAARWATRLLPAAMVLLAASVPALSMLSPVVLGLCGVAPTLALALAARGHFSVVAPFQFLEKPDAS